VNHLKRRSLCKKCRVCFVRDNDTQVYCHSCLETAKSSYENKEPKDKKCLVCKIRFIPTYGRSTCSSQCKKELIKKNKYLYREKLEVEKAEEAGFTKEAHRWINSKKRERKLPFSFSDQVKKMEYSRVFGKYSESYIYFKRKGFGK
jgi:hypothetical protein